MALADFIQSNWQPITAIIGVSLTALSTLGIVSGPRARGRQKLKLDLEIHKLMKESKETWTHQDDVKREIEAISNEIYVPDDGFRHAYHTTIGFALAGGFGWWTYAILKNDETGSFEFSWWILLTGYWCLVGLFIVAAGLNPPLRRKLWFVRTRPGGGAGITGQRRGQ